MNFGNYIIFPIIWWWYGHGRNRIASEYDMFVHIPKFLARILGHSLENLDNLRSVPVSVMGLVIQLTSLLLILFLLFPLNNEAIQNQEKLPAITAKVGVMGSVISIFITRIIILIISKR